MISTTDRGAIFADMRVFEEEWVPSDFESRDQELNAMASALEPILDDGLAMGLLLHGPSGVGKTSSSRYLLEKLREHTWDLETAFVNAWTDYTRYRILQRIVDDLSINNPNRYSGSAGDLRDAIESVSSPIVVILDEADQVDETDIFYDLYDIPNLEMILTANTPEGVYSGLEERIRSRLHGLHEVRFDPYTAAELVPILDQRVEHGMQPDVISSNLVEDIAHASNGNARDAITALKDAGQRAVDENADQIADDHVKAAIERADLQVKRESLDRLNQHQKTLLEIINDGDGINPGAIYESYESRVPSPRSRRTVRKYLAKLERYDLIEAEGTSQARTYRSKLTLGIPS